MATKTEKTPAATQWTDGFGRTMSDIADTARFSDEVTHQNAKKLFEGTEEEVTKRLYQTNVSEAIKDILDGKNGAPVKWATKLARISELVLAAQTWQKGEAKAPVGGC